MNNFRKMLLVFLLVVLWVPVGAEGVSIEELDRLNEESVQAYETSDYPTALKKWQTGLEQAREFSYKAYIGLFLGNIGRVYGNLGQYHKALNYYQQALIINKEINNKLREANNLQNIGIVYNNLGQYQIALDHYQKSLAINRKIDNKLGLGMNFSNIGVYYDNIAQYQTALYFYKQALIIDTEIHNKRGVGMNLSNIGIVYAELSNYKTALDYFQRALTIKREIGDKEGEGTDLTNIGVVYRNLGQYQTSLGYYQKALLIDREIGNKLGEAANLTNIGVIYGYLGQYQSALKYYKYALGIDHKIGDLRGEGIDLNNISVVYRNLGQYQIALKFSKKALDINLKIQNKRGVGYNLSNMGVLYRNLGQYQIALDYYQNALTIHHEIGDIYWVANELSNLGTVSYSRDQYQTALDYYQKALKIRHAIGDLRGEGSDLISIGVVYENLEQYPKAKEHFEKSINIFEKIGADGLWIAQRGLAFSKTKLNQYNGAIKYYIQAIDNINKIRLSLKDKEQKLSFIQPKLYVYDEFIVLLQSLHKTQPQKGYNRKAIEIFERKQSRIFLEEMGQSGARLFAGLPQEILQSESDLENKLAQTRKNLVDERSKPAAGLKGEVVQNKQSIKNLEQLEQKLQTQLEELQQTIKTKYPDYYALKYPKPVKLDNLQKSVLQSDELMLVYGVMENSTTLWVIGKNTFEMFDLPLSESVLEKQIVQLRDWIGTGDKTRGFNVTDRKYGEIKVKLNQASHELYAQLIPEKVRNLLTKERTVYVIPTGPLYALPFETLVTETSKDFKEAHYLIEDVPIAYLSSASLLNILRDAQKRRQNTAKYPLLAFANPIYEGTPTSSSTKRGIIDNLRHETYRNFKNGFAPLPETEDEAKEIAKLLNAPTDSNALQLRQAASVPTVNKFNDKTRLDDYQYVLFSTHGILSGEVDRINQPALVLSYPDTWGYLKMADVFGLKLNAKLVALSACNTGNGENEKGEGVMGLTRAFMYAGTPAIAVTLWSVESLSAKTLNVGLFKELKNNQKPAAALRAIKLRMLRGDEGEKYQRPYYWAPFVVFGDAGL